MNDFSPYQLTLSFERLIIDLQKSNFQTKDHLINICCIESDFFPGADFLYHVCMRATIEEVRWLRNHEYFQILWGGRAGVTAFMLAASEANIRCVSMMIHEGFDIYASDRNGNNGLMHTIIGSATYVPFNPLARLSCITMLLEAGVPINSRNKEKDTPLLLLALRSHYNCDRYLPIMNLLLSYEADPNAINSDGKSPVTSMLWNWNIYKSVVIPQGFAMLISHGAVTSVDMDYFLMK